MAKMYCLVMTLLATLAVTFGVPTKPPIHPTTLPPPGKTWAFLVATVKGWDYYWAQSDVCRAYHLLIARGIPAAQIIVMMYDDIAKDPRNPVKNAIYNYPGGPNVYDKCVIDYKFKDVTADLFLAVLHGDKAAAKGHGTGRVIESGPHDNIFINLETRDGPNLDVYEFPGGDAIPTGRLLDVLFELYYKKKLNEALVFYQIDNYLEGAAERTNRFKHTAVVGDRFTPKYYNVTLKTAMSGVFTSAWMDALEMRMNCLRDTLGNLYACVQGAAPNAYIGAESNLQMSSLSKFLGE